MVILINSSIKILKFVTLLPKTKGKKLSFHFIFLRWCIKWVEIGHVLSTPLIKVRADLPEESDPPFNTNCHPYLRLCIQIPLS